MSRPQQGDLANVTVHEREEAWPTIIEVVAYFSKDGSRKGQRRSIEIDADQFFGRNGYGAPLSGDQLIGMVNALRRQPRK